MYDTQKEIEMERESRCLIHKKKYKERERGPLYIYFVCPTSS